MRPIGYVEKERAVQRLVDTLVLEGHDKKGEVTP